MTIGVVARKLLWARAGNQCAFPDCVQPLTEDLHDADSSTLRVQGVVLGEEAHIRSGQSDGPRYEAAYPVDSIDTYENLILLCPTHHTLVDKDKGRGFTTEQLLSIKSAHEAQLNAQRSTTERARLQAEERTATAVARWGEARYIQEFGRLTYGLNQAVPVIRESNFDSLIGTGQVLLARVWPIFLPRIAAAFDRHRRAISLLTQHINQSMEMLEGSEPHRRTERAYKRLSKWDPPAYDRLFEQFLVDCVATWYLTFHLVRTGNLIIRAIHAELDPLFRFDEGLLLMHSGDGVLEHKMTRVEYETQNTAELPDLPTLAEIKDRISSLARATSTGRADDISISDIDAVPDSTKP